MNELQSMQALSGNALESRDGEVCRVALLLRVFVELIKVVPKQLRNNEQMLFEIKEICR